MTPLRVVDWNVDGFGSVDGAIALLDGLSWDILLLQEVTRASWPRFRALGSGGGWSGPHLPVLQRPPRYHSAIVVRGGWTFTDGGPVPHVPSPERSLTGTVTREGATCLVASLALPPGVSWGDAGKGRQADRIASWLADRRLPAVVGIDANTPKFDRADLPDNEWWNDQEPLLLGESRVHDLRDAYRDVLEHDGSRRASGVAARPHGPLAVTHLRGRGASQTECRYDHVLCSPEIDVVDVEHLWDEARDAGSDHALVRADLVVHAAEGATVAEGRTADGGERR